MSLEYLNSRVDFRIHQQYDNMKARRVQVGPRNNIHFQNNRANHSSKGTRRCRLLRDGPNVFSCGDHDDRDDLFHRGLHGDLLVLLDVHLDDLLDDPGNFRRVKNSKNTAKWPIK